MLPAINQFHMRVGRILKQCQYRRLKLSKENTPPIPSSLFNWIALMSDLFGPWRQINSQTCTMPKTFTWHQHRNQRKIVGRILWTRNTYPPFITHPYLRVLHRPWHLLRSKDLLPSLLVGCSMCSMFTNKLKALAVPRCTTTGLHNLFSLWLRAHTTKSSCSTSLKFKDKIKLLSQVYLHTLVWIFLYIIFLFTHFSSVVYSHCCIVSKIM